MANKTGADCWAAWDPGKMAYWTGSVRASRHEAIQAVTVAFNESWQEVKRWGWRVEPIRITRRKMKPKK